MRSRSISSETHPEINFKFKTIHSSKGLEADAVVILECNSGKHGFPSEITDDPILSLVLSKGESYPHAEERRLFYVAMTRAAKQLYIVCNSEKKSSFVFEISPKAKGSNQTCPWCEIGNIEERRGPYGLYIRCDNFHYCNYSKSIDQAYLNRRAFELLNAKDLGAEKYFEEIINNFNPKDKHYMFCAKYRFNRKDYAGSLELSLIHI